MKTNTALKLLALTILFCQLSAEGQKTTPQLEEKVTEEVSNLKTEQKPEIEVTNEETTEIKEPQEKTLLEKQTTKIEETKPVEKEETKVEETKPIEKETTKIEETKVVVKEETQTEKFNPKRQTLFGLLFFLFGTLTIFGCLVLAAAVVYYRQELKRTKQVPFEVPDSLSFLFPNPTNDQIEINNLCSKYLDN